MLRRAREKKGLTLRDLMVEVDVILPRALRLNDETIRAYELGRFPKRGLDPLVVAALAKVLELDAKDIDAGIGDDIGKIYRLVTSTGIKDVTIGSPKMAADQPLAS